MIGQRGPNVSSRMQAIEWSTSMSTVGFEVVARLPSMATDPDAGATFDGVSYVRFDELELSCSGHCADLEFECAWRVRALPNCTHGRGRFRHNSSSYARPRHTPVTDTHSLAAIEHPAPDRGMHCAVDIGIRPARSSGLFRLMELISSVRFAGILVERRGLITEPPNGEHCFSLRVMVDCPNARSCPGLVGEVICSRLWDVVPVEY